MGKELSLAREEKERRSVLLARPGGGAAGSAEVRREEGKKASAPLIRREGRTPSAATASRKGNAASAHRGGKGSFSARRGDNNQNGREVGGVEGEDTSARGSAEKLGLEWFGSDCSRSPSCAHHLTEIVKTGGDGAIFMCAYCYRAKWLPTSISSAEVFTVLAKRKGHQAAYWQLLDQHPTARRVLSQMHLLYLAADKMSAMEFGRALNSIISLVRQVEEPSGNLRASGMYNWKMAKE